MDYKLLTPGPLTTSRAVKQEMLFDYSTWDTEYKEVTQSIRYDLLDLAQVDKDIYTTVLMQGSGTFGVESVISSVIGEDEKLFVVSNGAYGDRIVDMCEIHKINYTLFREDDHECINVDDVVNVLDKDKDITHLAIVHSETTTGLVNDIQAVGQVCKERGLVYIVDAMSSFGGMELPTQDWNIDFLVSSANKCIQGVPGFSFIIGRKNLIIEAKDKSRSLSLGLYDQWKTMDVDGKFRFTSPTHTVLAFRKALDELLEETLEGRTKRFAENNKLLNERMAGYGFENYLSPKQQGPFISTFLVPEDRNFDFNELYQYAKSAGYVIYPGKLTDRDSFRLGNIGEIYRQDIINITGIINDYMETKNPSQTQIIVFDWAGTTVDFGCMAPVEAFKKAFDSVGIEVKQEEIRKPMGMSKIDHVRTMFQMERISNLWKEKYGDMWTEEDVQKVYKVSETALLETVGENSEPKPYVLETIAKLREKGIHIGSTTGYNKAMMEIVLEKSQEAGFKVDSLVTSEDTQGKGRPYPYMIYKNMERFGIQKASSVIKVGDTVADILEGKNANVKTIAVVDGSSEMGLSLEEFEALSEEEKEIHRSRVRQVFLKAGADKVIQDFRELLEEI